MGKGIVVIILVLFLSALLRLESKVIVAACEFVTYELGKPLRTQINYVTNSENYVTNSGKYVTNSENSPNHTTDISQYRLRFGSSLLYKSVFHLNSLTAQLSYEGRVVVEGGN
jgi:hypothetical protein